QAMVEGVGEGAMAAVEAAGRETLLGGGGVAANSCLQREMRAAAERRGIAVSFPPLSLCTDNAAMIAAVGHSLLERGRADDLDLDTSARAPLTMERGAGEGGAWPVGGMAVWRYGSLAVWNYGSWIGVTYASPPHVHTSIPPHIRSAPPYSGNFSGARACCQPSPVSALRNSTRSAFSCGVRRSGFRRWSR